MSASASQIEELLTRLSSLEESNKAMKAEIYDLQRDNISLQKDVLTVQRENDSLKKKIDGLEEREVRHVSEIERLRRRVTQMSKSSKQSSKEIMDQMKQLHEVRRVLNRALVEAQHCTDMKKEVNEVTRRTTDIERTLRLSSQISTYVELVNSVPLVRGQRIHLDKCAKIVKNNGSFDVVSCCLVPVVDGVYALNVVFRQYGKGKLRAFAKGDNNLDLHVGMTESANDISSILRFWKLKRGQKVWIEARLAEGDACLRWCNFYSWLV